MPTQTESTWLTRGVRISIFPSVVVEDASSWWEKVIGTAPESEIRQRARGLFQQQGSFHDGRLFLVVVPERIDWIWQATDKSEEAESEDLATLGSFEEAIRKFSSCTGAWFPMSPAAARIALGADLIQPVDTPAQGNNRLQSYIKTVDLAGAADFLYRINRPRTSHSLGLEGLKINRLSTWSIIQSKMLSLSIPPTTTPKQSVTVWPLSRPACRLELDINTAQDYQGEIGPEELHILFGEFVQLGSEIAEHGDVR
jgi:hypothetical protein